MQPFEVVYRWKGVQEEDVATAAERIADVGGAVANSEPLEDVAAVAVGVIEEPTAGDAVAWRQHAALEQRGGRE